RVRRAHQPRSIRPRATPAPRSSHAAVRTATKWAGPSATLRRRVGPRRPDDSRRATCTQAQGPTAGAMATQDAVARLEPTRRGHRTASRRELPTWFLQSSKRHRRTVSAVLFPGRFWAGLEDGSVTVAFRRQKRATVKEGGTLNSPGGLLSID